jgi:hypothetical protein
VWNAAEPCSWRGFATWAAVLSLYLCSSAAIRPFVEMPLGLTCCGPCKASLSELATFERKSRIPVVAITDESPEQIKAFFKEYDGPFPAIIAVGELSCAGRSLPMG